jgi:transcription elongation factor GreA
VKELFEEDFIEFFTILIRSYGGTITLDEIKRELIPEFVEEKNWTRWWNRARTQIKKNPNFGVSEKKKNEFFLRDKPLTFADELLDSFTATDSFTEKLNIAIEFVNNIDAAEGASVAPYFIDYFADEARGDSMTRQVLSYFILKDLDAMAPSSAVKLESVHAKVMEFIRESSELPILSRKIGSYDYKKELVNLIEEAREDWPSIYYDILFEVPVRIHKYIMNRLIIAHEYQVINEYIDQVLTGYKEFPELFLWVARNLLNGTWSYDWLDYSRQQLVINFFRFMNELKKVETEGNRLKNACVDLLFDNNEKVLRDIVSQFDQAFMGKVYDIFRNLAYVEESKKERVQEIIREYYPDFSISEQTGQGGFDTPGEKLIVTPESYERKKAILDRMVNEDLVNLSKELSRVAENSSDPRENVDYNALMEKQNILEVEVSKLEEEIRKAEILDPQSIPVDTVSVGSRVTLRDMENNEQITYTVLGPWDADFGRHILSYRSPIAKTLLGKQEGDETVISINDEERSFRVEAIERYSA